MLKTFILSIIILGSTSPLLAQRVTTPDVTPNYIIERVNEIRSKGCRCGRTKMPPVKPVTWNGDLYKTASDYANYMHRTNRFEHTTRSGENVGDRLDKVGYAFQHCGENIALGYSDFESVLSGWLESKSHCKMIMDTNMKHMAVGRYDKYWVQHFGSPQPSNTRRIGTKYTEN